MELKEGMYVRTEIGTIGKITKITNENIFFDRQVFTNHRYCYSNTKYLRKEISEKYIIKASNNIIDLIEVGDYVNGYKVYYCYCADEDMTGLFIDTEERKRIWLDKPSQIKSIVTKEQFESMSYKL